MLAAIETDKPVSVSISVAFGCPFEGAVDPVRVLEIVERASELGADEVVLADTIGVAVPRQVKELVSETARRARRTGIHLHNTRNTGFAAAYAALEAGATVFEASVGGLGGCPFAPRATGNVATEDLVYLLHGGGNGCRPRRAHRCLRVARVPPRTGAPARSTGPEPSRRSRAEAFPLVLALGSLLAGAGILLARIVDDVHGKPLFEDEAVSGLISARPLGEVIETVIWERGGGPLHFVFSHIALAFDSSPYALRWLSVVFALAALPLCWDVGRRLGGPVAGAVAALVAATSSFLLVYGTFARMYTLYVFAAALAVDLFLVANERRTGRWAFAAAGAAWLLPAIHPYGAFLVAAEALVALWLWRGRPFRPAIPTLAVGVAMIPFAIADLRLADRFAVGLDGEESIAAPTDAWGQLGRAFSATAGGSGIWAGLFIVALTAGLVLLVRRNGAFVALCLVAFLLPPVLLLLGRSGSEPGLSPRHLVYVVPLVGALIGVAVARAVQGRGELVSAGAVVLTGVLLVAAPFGGIRDPRDWQNDVLGGGRPTRRSARTTGSRPPLPG